MVWQSSYSALLCLLVKTAGFQLRLKIIELWVCIHLYLNAFNTLMSLRKSVSSADHTFLFLVVLELEIGTNVTIQPMTLFGTWPWKRLTLTWNKPYTTTRRCPWDQFNRSQLVFEISFHTWPNTPHSHCRRTQVQKKKMCKCEKAIESCADYFLVLIRKKISSGNDLFCLSSLVTPSIWGICNSHKTKTDLPGNLISLAFSWSLLALWGRILENTGDSEDIKSSVL